MCVMHWPIRLSLAILLQLLVVGDCRLFAAQRLNDNGYARRTWPVKTMNSVFGSSAACRVVTAASSRRSASSTASSLVPAPPLWPCAASRGPHQDVTEESTDMRRFDRAQQQAAAGES